MGSVWMQYLTYVSNPKGIILIELRINDDDDGKEYLLTLLLYL